MRVPLVDLSTVHAELQAEIGSAIRRVIDANAFAGGPEVEAFERRFAEACGTRHCIGVSSGTAALELILRAAGIGEGQEVIVPVNTFVADAEAAGRRVDATDPDFGKSAQFLIGRARYDPYTGSHIGAIVTDREFLDSYNRVAGVDGQFRLRRADTLNVIFVQSDTWREDGERLSGPMWGTLYRHTGRHLRGQMFFGITDPGFPTDTGFVQRVDTKLVGVNTGYRWWPGELDHQLGPERQCHQERHLRRCTRRRVSGWRFERHVRGTGVLRHTDDGWKLVHYSLSFPIPNDVTRAEGGARASELVPHP